MPVHRDVRTLAAATTVANVLTSTLWEFARIPTLVSIWGVQTGAAAATPLLATLFLGNATPMENFPVPDTSAGVGPNKSDHGLLSNHLAAPNDRIVYRLQNTDPANASTARTLFEFIPA